MYGNQRERIPDLLESPNSRRDLRNSRLSNDHLRRYEVSKYERLSPHPRRRLTNNIRLEQQYHNFQGNSSSDECLTKESRNKSKSTSSIDTQSVNNILDEYEDLDYRKSSDLSDIDVGSVEVTNFEEMMDLQKRQVMEKQNSRMSKSQSHVASIKDHHHVVVSPTKVSRQTQVQQRSRDRQKDGERRYLSPTDDRKNSIPGFQEKPEVRTSIRSAKSPPEVLLRKGEVQKRVDEWLSQTRNQNCAGYIKESKGLTRSNSSAEQKNHRRLRQQELRSRRSQLNGSSSYDDLTHEGLKAERNRVSDSNKVSVGVNTSRGTYKQYLALKNQARLQKQQQKQQQQHEDNTNSQEGRKTNFVLRSREASPASRLHYHSSRGDAMNLSFRSASSKRQEVSEQDQQQQQQYGWIDEAAMPINIKSKNARARHQMENRIYNLIKARNESSATSEIAATTTGVGRRSSFKRESTRSVSKSANASPSKDAEESVIVRPSQDQTIGIPTRNNEQESKVACTESNAPTESTSSDLSQEMYGSVSARVRAFQGRSEHRMPKSRSLQGSSILIETSRNKSPMSPTRNDVFHYGSELERKQQQSTFKPNVMSLNQQNEQKREIDSTTRYVEKIYETTLQPEVIHADNLESVFRPGRTNFVYGDTTSKDVMSSSAPIFKREDESGKRKTNCHNKEPEGKQPESPLNHCLKLLQRSPSFRLKRSHPVQKEKESYAKSSISEQAVAVSDQPKQIHSFETFQTTSPSTVTPQINTTESPKETSTNEQSSFMREKLDPNSYEARSTLKLNSPKTVNDQTENEKNKQKDGSLKENAFSLRQGIVSSKNESAMSTANNSEQSYNSLREKSEDGAVINEVLVKNLQFKQDLPSSTPPPPPPRTCVEPVRRQESALIVELTPLHNKPLNYNSVLSDDYEKLHSRAYQQQRQEGNKIYVTKEEMERKKLMDLLRKREYELVKMLVDQIKRDIYQPIQEKHPLILEKRMFKYYLLPLNLSINQSSTVDPPVAASILLRVL